MNADDGKAGSAVFRCGRTGCGHEWTGGPGTSICPACGGESAIPVPLGVGLAFREPLPPEVLVFSHQGGEYLRFEPSGDVYVRGEKVDSNQEVYVAVTKWLAMATEELEHKRSAKEPVHSP